MDVYLGKTDSKSTELAKLKEEFGISDLLCMFLSRTTTRSCIHFAIIEEYAVILFGLLTLI